MRRRERARDALADAGRAILDPAYDVGAGAQAQRREPRQLLIDDPVAEVGRDRRADGLPVRTVRARDRDDHRGGVRLDRSKSC